METLLQPLKNVLAQFGRLIQQKFIVLTKPVLLILKPDTLLGWHRQGFKLLWKFKSKPRIEAETIALIKQMVSVNPL